MATASSAIGHFVGTNRRLTIFNRDENLKSGSLSTNQIVGGKRLRSVMSVVICLAKATPPCSLGPETAKVDRLGAIRMKCDFAT